jgi:predicted alpha/beta hydrolase
MQNTSNMIKSESQKLGEIPVNVHWIQTKDNAEIALSHIEPKNHPGKSLPIILLHGTYSMRNFWISDKGIGLGTYLSNAGFDIWIPELRGHGLSPKGKEFSSITAEQQIRFDIPAIQNFVYQQTRTPVTWICHSFGGIYLLASLSVKWLDQEPIRGILTFGSQISKGEGFLKIPPLAWLCIGILKLLGNFPAPFFGMGPEVEAAGAMIEVIQWKKFRGKWANAEGISYWDGLKRIQIPVCCFAAAADKNDPPEGCEILYNHIGSSRKTFSILGKKHGFSKDYDHIGMIVSKEAQAEIWPLIAGQIGLLGQPEPD